MPPRIMESCPTTRAHGYLLGLSVPLSRWGFFWAITSPASAVSGLVISSRAEKHDVNRSEAIRRLVELGLKAKPRA